MPDYPKRKFDFIFSLGENCACSKYLREYHLQNYSYPFDWLRNPGFGERIDILVNHFEDFCNKEDFVLLPESDKEQSVRRLYYYNRRNRFHFIHDFKRDPGFEAMYPEVQEKYRRRIGRLYQKIHASESVLVVWFNQNYQLGKEEILESTDRLQKIFPDQHWYFLIVEHEESGSGIQEEHLRDNIVVCRYDMKNDEITGEELKKMQGDPQLAGKIFSVLQLNRTIRERIYYFMLSWLIRLHPVKKTRKLLKKKYALKLFYAGIQLMTEVDIDPEIFF